MAHIQRWIVENFGHPGLVCDSCASLMGKVHSSRILCKTYGENWIQLSVHARGNLPSPFTVLCPVGSVVSDSLQPHGL